MSLVLACLKAGKVWLLSENQEPRELESPFAEQVRNREHKLAQRHAWKTQGRGAEFMGGGTRSMLWGAAEQTLPVAQVVGVSRGRSEHELFYAITTGVVSGIFAQTPRSAASERAAQPPDEQRIFHNADVRVSELALSVDDEAVACTVEGKDGVSAIGLLADDGRGVRTVTEGDVMDRAPRWVPGGARQLVYASAGIGRTASGQYVGLSPFAVHRLSLRDGSVEVVAMDAKYDYLAPVAVAEDEIYAIRRPYKDIDAPPSVWRVLLDALLMPFRLVFALFQYLSFFSARYTGKPLITSGNARQKAADAERMLVWGNLVDVREQAGAEAKHESQLARGYELVKITRKGIAPVHKGVLAFDLAPDGTLYFSSGSAVFRLQSGSPQKLADLAGVTQLAVC
jgi:hypothetical protein